MADILVVDDVENIRMAIKFALESQNHAVALAENGEEAMEILKRMTFDLVITDVLMPHKDGIDLMRFLQEQRPNVPVIAISGGGNTTSYKEIAKVVKSHGAKILEKPFSKDILLQTVDDRLKAKITIA